MADNTPQNGTASIAADDVTTLNGAASSGVLVQRVKVMHGPDNTATDVSVVSPLPIVSSDGTVAGTITATDAVLGVHSGDGTVLTGTPTANSYIAYPIRGGESGFTLRLSGTFGGGTVWMESSADSTNGVDGGWVTNLVRQSGVDITFLDTSLTAPGVFRGVGAGYSYLRVRVTGATAPSIGVVFRASAGSSVTAQVASLPPGSNTFGALHPASMASVGTTSKSINTAYLTGTTAQASSAVLVTAPAAGLSIYVTDMEASNEGATATRVTYLEGATVRYARFMAASGGGYVSNLKTPWKLPAATALSYQVSAATTWHQTVNYYIAP